MTEKLSKTSQDYLKYIFTLSEGGKPANTSDLAKRLKVSPASVTEMLDRLASAEPPLVIYKKYQGAMLTEAGRQAALEVLRIHRLLETFLVEILGYSWDNIHEEACRLEHVISKEFCERIADLLGNPTYTPHGEPIPTEDMSMPVQVTRSLGSLRSGDVAHIRRVLDDDAGLLRYLSENGIVPYNKITVVGYSEFDENLTINVEGFEAAVVIGPKVAGKIFVSP